MSPAQILKWLAILLAIIGLLGLVSYALWLTSERSNAGVVQQTVSSQSVVDAVRGVGRLELTHYRLSVTQASETNVPIVLGMFQIPRRSKVLVIASGEAIGCLDLAKLDSAAVQITDSVVTLRLPAPEVCTHRVILSESEVYSAEHSLLMLGDDKMKAALVRGAFKDAEQTVLETALKRGILDETNKQAQTFLTSLLMRLGFKRVVIVPAPMGDR